MEVSGAEDLTVFIITRSPMFRVEDMFIAVVDCIDQRCAGELAIKFNRRNSVCEAVIVTLLQFAAGRAEPNAKLKINGSNAKFHDISLLNMKHYTDI